MRTSCIEHGADEKFVMIRRPYMELVGGNACAAALLSVFEQWTNTRIDHREQAEAINRRDRKAKRAESQDTDLWIYRTKTELIDDDLCGAFGRGAFDKAIEILVGMELVERRHNPDNPRDRTLHYRLDVERLNGLLEQKRKSAFGKADSDSSKSGKERLLDGEKNLEKTPTSPVSPLRRKVGGSRVTDDEYALATEIIAAFNQAAGTRVTTDAHLTPIVGRIREKPDLTADDHRGIIAAVFAVPWWDGAPGPAVIYGNAGIFERSIETWRARPARSRSRAAAGAPNLPADAAARRAEFEPRWQETLDRLRLGCGVPETTFKSWFEPLVLVGGDDDRVYLTSDEERVRGWAAKRYASLIAEAFADGLDHKVEVVFVDPPPPASEQAA